MKSKTLYKLYLDETGTISDKILNPKLFPYFVLSGVIVNAYEQESLKIRADRVKFKYWNDIKVVFHSREIGKRENSFQILKDPNIESSFHNDLVVFLTNSSVKCIVVAVDKQKAINLKWGQKEIYENSVIEMLEFFISFLDKKKARGQIFIESAGSQKDILFMKKYMFYLANGFSAIGLGNKDIKNVLTSVNFVTKNNLDIETQMADLLSYPAGYQCMCESGIKNITQNSYEDKMCKVLKSKLMSINNRSSFIKIPK